MRNDNCMDKIHPETTHPQPAITAADIETWPDVMDVPQLAAALDLRSRGVVYRLVENRQIPFKRVGKVIKFTKASIIKWLNDQAA